MNLDYSCSSSVNNSGLCCASVQIWRNFPDFPDFPDLEEFPSNGLKALVSQTRGPVAPGSIFILSRSKKKEPGGVNCLLELRIWGQFPEKKNRVENMEFPRVLKK